MPAYLLERAEFFKKFHLQDDTLDKTGLAWPDLQEIHHLHASAVPKLQVAANFIGGILQQVDEVHSLKVRIKNPEHVVEKIIRKKLLDLSRDLITSKNYVQQITDLIGVRALHLFKEEWSSIHDCIIKTWEMIETPVAYVRKGDPDAILKAFEQRGCDVRNHKYGYRSVHYCIKLQPSKEVHIAELQVRTIFEEGWSEIDHRVRYPYDRDNEVLLHHSRILNGLAGSADEMGSFITLLKRQDSKGP